MQTAARRRIEADYSFARRIHKITRIYDMLLEPRGC
jgi:hypothetical protein